MKRNHLFASAAIACCVGCDAACSCADSGWRHARRGNQHAVSHGSVVGSVPVRSAASSQTDLSASARAGGRVDGLGRVDRTAKTGGARGRSRCRARQGGCRRRGPERRGAGESAASKASDAALGTTRAAAGATAATSVTAAGQGEAQVRSVDAAGAVAGGLSITEESRTKAATGSSKPSPGEPVKPDTAGRPSHSSATPAPQPKTEGRKPWRRDGSQHR